MKRLTSFDLKIIAMITMTIDHIGYFLFPGVQWLRIIGRLAFPIYAFLCAESFRHTHDRKLYLSRLLVIGALMEVVLQIVEPGSPANIFLTLACGFGILWGLEEKQVLLAGGMFVAGVLLNVDYYWYGMLMIPAMYYCKDRLWLMFPIIFAMSYVYINTSTCSPNQYYSIFAILILLMYNGQVGCKKGKYFFYAYYPIHVAILALMSGL